jgi:nitroimidazol reductase NimA-like FMN-containing flavoprotein (pyridoxamine 5'-phosphate oxidase superfamily)
LNHGPNQQIVSDAKLINGGRTGIAMSTMRRRDKEITEKVVIEEVLRENQVGRLGTAVDGEPYVVPMNYAYLSGRILMHTHRDGKKVYDIKRNPRVCFEVDSGEMVEGDDPCGYSWEYRSVIAHGDARIVEDPEEKLRALRVISDKYAFGKGQRLDQAKVDRFSDLVIIEVTIRDMTGKRSPVKPKEQ